MRSETKSGHCPMLRMKLSSLSLRCNSASWGRSTVKDGIKLFLTEFNCRHWKATIFLSGDCFYIHSWQVKKVNLMDISWRLHVHLGKMFWLRIMFSFIYIIVFNVYVIYCLNINSHKVCLSKEMKRVITSQQATTCYYKAKYKTLWRGILPYDPVTPRTSVHNKSIFCRPRRRTMCCRLFPALQHESEQQAELTADRVNNSQRSQTHTAGLRVSVQKNVKP